MKLISIQKKPPLGWELLMVFIISLYFNLFMSIPYGAIKRVLVTFQFLEATLGAGYNSFVKKRKSDSHQSKPLPD